MFAYAARDVPGKCKPHLVAYCPTMDLVALATEDGQVHVFRLNGQRVFAASYEGEPGNIKGLKWKPNGQTLAVAFTDNVVRLISASSGKSIHQLPAVCQTSTANISYLSWAVNFTNSQATQQQLNSVSKNVSLDDLLGLNAQMPTLLKSKADLPREFALVDVETSLPKLSTLPISGGDEDVFSTRASIDSIFHSSSRGAQNDVVDILMTGFDDGSLYLRIFDCFEIGSVSLASSLPTRSKSISLLNHAFHPLTSTHILVVQDTIPSSTALHLLTLDFNFIPLTAPYYLPTLATKSTQLQNLLRYLLQIRSQLAFEVKSAFDLPSKYLRNINETLGEHSPGATFITAAYDLIVTGECAPQLKEWLVDELGERGLKRWEKAVLVGLETMRRLVHECLMPAIERCYVVLSRLEGLSRFQKAARVLGLDTKPLTLARNTLDCLDELAHKLLQVVGREIREFAAFLKWLRFETELQGLELDSERAEELREGSDDIDYRTAVDYISGAMNESGTLLYIRPTSTTTDGGVTGGRQHGDEGRAYPAKFNGSQNVQGQARTLPKLDELVERLQNHCAAVFSQIAETLQRSIMSSHIFAIPKDHDKDVLDIRMIADESDTNAMEVRVASRHASKKSQINYTQLRGKRSGSRITATKHFQTRAVLLGKMERVIDLRFLDDAELLVLVRARVKAEIRSLDLKKEQPTWRKICGFDGSAGGLGKPSKLEVSGRNGRRMICVLNEEGTKYVVFDLDHENRQNGRTTTEQAWTMDLDQGVEGMELDEGMIE